MYKLLNEWVTDFEGMMLIYCFKDEMVVPFEDLGDRVMFKTKNGTLFEVYKSKIKH